MKAILLAAGLGTRLKPLTATVPKCLTEVNGQPILVNALEQVARCGLTEAIVVVGHLQDTIRQRVGNHIGRMPVSYVENTRYATTNTSYSLWLGLHSVDNEDVVILEGDVFFAPNLLVDFLKSPEPNATVVQKYHPGLDGSFVELHNNLVVNWVHASRRTEDFVIENAFKTVNIHKFTAAFVEKTLKPLLHKHIESSAGREPIEYVLQDVVTGSPSVIHAFDAKDTKWVEIDDRVDLQRAQAMFARSSGKPSLDAVRALHGGYWRYDHIDFHYLFNHHFPTPELYAELAAQLPQIGNYYPSSQSTLAQLLSRWKAEEYFTADNLIVGNGSSELIRLLNDHVVTRVTVPLPTYNEFVRLPDEKIHTYVLDEARNFVLDPDQLLAEIARSQSEWAVIINPNNPTGTLTSLADIETILKTGVMLVVDEAFMVFAGTEYSAERLVPTYSNLVVVVSCTKSLGIAGLRLGYLLTSNTDVKEKMRYHLPIWNINSLTEYLVEVFPKYQKDHAASIVKSVADTRWFGESLQAISYLTPYPTYANAVFCKVQGSARRLAEILYEQYNLMVKEGLNQAEIVTDSYVRLGVRNRADNALLLTALKEIDASSLAPARDTSAAVQPERVSST